MPIDVEWQDESGRRLARHGGPPIDHRPPGSAPADSACLRFIDPYGDTTFNAAQVAILEQELAAIRSTHSELAGQADALMAFLKRVGDRTHRYLKFIGD